MIRPQLIIKDQIQSDQSKLNAFKSYQKHSITPETLDDNSHTLLIDETYPNLYDNEPINH